MTTLATITGTGEVEIPETFARDYRCLSAALDWARVFGTSGRYADAARELESVACHAENILLAARRLAKTARDMDASTPRKEG